MFMGINLTFGMSVALAVLLLARGWWGVVVSIPVAIATNVQWGDPYLGYLYILEATFLTILINKRDGASFLKKGTVLIWDFIFWLLIGSPLYFAAEYFFNNTSVKESFLVAQKSIANGVFDILVAYIIYATITIYHNKRSSISPNISIQGLVLIIIYSVIVFSTIFTISVLYRGLIDIKSNSIINKIEDSSQIIFDGLGDSKVPKKEAVQALTNYRTEWTFFWTKDGASSNLFAAGPLATSDGILPNHYKDTGKAIRLGKRLKALAKDGDTIEIYFPKNSHERIFSKRVEKSLVRAILHDGDETVIIIHPAEKSFMQIGEFYNFSLLTTNLSFLIGIILSTIIAWFIGKEFRFVLYGPKVKHEGIKLSNEEKRLQLSPISELKDLADEINERTEVIYKDKLKIEELNIISQQQLSTAGEIQECFLGNRSPSKRPDLSLYMRPAYNAGGDWYDAFDLDNKTFIVVADVCDKGVGAALFMSVFRSLIRYSAENFCASPSESEPLDEVISSVNNYMSEEHSDMHMFATVFIACICTKSKRIDYVLAGHEQPIFLDSQGNQHALEMTGPAIGLFPGAAYTIGSLPYTDGCILVGYSDGVIDARNSSGESYGYQRLVDLIKKTTSTHHQMKAVVIRDEIVKEVDSHMNGEEQFDDITIAAAVL